MGVDGLQVSEWFFEAFCNTSVHVEVVVEISSQSYVHCKDVCNFHLQSKIQNSAAVVKTVLAPWSFLAQLIVTSACLVLILPSGTGAGPVSSLVTVETLYQQSCCLIFVWSIYGRRDRDRTVSDCFESHTGLNYLHLGQKDIWYSSLVVTEFRWAPCFAVAEGHFAVSRVLASLVFASPANVVPQPLPLEPSLRWSHSVVWILSLNHLRNMRDEQQEWLVSDVSSV